MNKPDRKSTARADIRREMDKRMQPKPKPAVQEYKMCAPCVLITMLAGIGVMAMLSSGITAQAFVIIAAGTAIAGMQVLLPANRAVLISSSVIAGSLALWLFSAVSPLLIEAALALIALGLAFLIGQELFGRDRDHRSQNWHVPEYDRFERLSHAPSESVRLAQVKRRRIFDSLSDETSPPSPREPKRLPSSIPATPLRLIEKVRR
jgi:hypothetical protein